MGLLNIYLGIQFMQSAKGIFMQQSKYVQILLECFKFQDCKLITTPINPELKYSMYDGSEPFTARIYATQGLIFSMQYHK